MITLRSSLPYLIGFLALPANGLAQNIVLGQPSTAASALGTRCPNSNAPLNYSAGIGGIYGPPGMAGDPRGRVYVTVYAGPRVLPWPDSDALQTCSTADSVIDQAGLSGPE